MHAQPPSATCPAFVASLETCLSSYVATLFPWIAMSAIVCQATSDIVDLVSLVREMGWLWLRSSQKDGNHMCGLRPLPTPYPAPSDFLRIRFFSSYDTFRRRPIINSTHLVNPEGRLPGFMWSCTCLLRAKSAFPQNTGPPIIFQRCHLTATC